MSLESSDEGVGALSDESDEGGQVSERLRQENLSLNHQLDAERQRCQAMEERNQVLETQLISLMQNPQSTHVHTLEVKTPISFYSYQHLYGIRLIYFPHVNLWNALKCILLLNPRIMLLGWYNDIYWKISLHFYIARLILLNAWGLTLR